MTISPFRGAAVGRRRIWTVLLSLAAAAAVAAVAIAAGVGLLSDKSGAAQPDASAPDPAATQFLRTSVTADGRVVRRDQGGDTVSEGQAYGMLLAVAVDDQPAFERIWTWTRHHLQQPDASLAWRWADGRITDTNPASDADLDAVRALQLAAQIWHRPQLSRAGDAIARVTLRTSTVPVRQGRLLVAGPWAVGHGSTPSVIDPSYLVAGEADQLAARTGQREWRAVGNATAAMDRTLLHGGRLPPDWAQLPAGSSSATDVVAADPPSGGGGVQYGLDAPRLYIRLATSCDGADRRLAATAPRDAVDLTAPGIRTLNGTDDVSWRHPITDVAAAAILAVRGQQRTARRALLDAEQQQRASPTYYGAVWIALATAQIMDHRLGGGAACVTT